MESSNWISRGRQSYTPAVDNRARVVRMAVSAGEGRLCVYCHKRIQPKDVEYEVDVYITAGLRTLQFHRVCLHLWEALP